jgi:aminoglycoside 6'-N-acetyltransferase
MSPMSLPLRTPRLLLRPLQEPDVAALTALLAEPEVARWWPGYDEARVREELLPPDEECLVLAVESEGQVIGAIQACEEEDPQYRHAGIDLFLGTAWQGRGLGPEAIGALVRYLFTERGHHRLVIDPAAENERAVRAYERVGFRRVGRMRCCVCRCD